MYFLSKTPNYVISSTQKISERLKEGLNLYDYITTHVITPL